MVETVLVKYIDAFYVCKYGVKPHEMDITVAKKYLDKGLIEIVEKPPAPIVTTHPEPAPEPEVDETIYTKVAWIPTPKDTQNILKAGKEFGFSTVEITPDNFSHSAVLFSEILVIDSSADTLNPAQKQYIKTLLFQSKKPFVFSVRSTSLVKDQFFARELIIQAKGIIFLQSEMMPWIDKFGELIQDWSFYEGEASLWRLVQKAINSQGASQ